MQLLHKCKDSHDDHFAQCQLWKYKVFQELMSASGHSSDDFLADTDESNILDHLDMINACHSVNSIHSMNEVNKCLEAVEESSLFSSDTTNSSAINVDEPDIETYVEDVSNQSLNLEASWELEYEKC